MKSKQLNELKTKTITDLKKKIADLEKEKTKILLETKMDRIKNVHAANNLRKDIARTKSIIRMKILAQNEEVKQDAAK